ncbi:PepSY-like domain-containing protein [Duncaniella sp.]|uniref:PepSY-like domain-containing protein n=1 Tax=Duncaniella sp. TaxID=2518496 RepID=UPI0023C043AD|nr:PepSY-like domain-containing protein [Duncaniella sp.]MDE5905687.1 PepSY-like domain-containing protein [Duncaniella sp.]
MKRTIITMLAGIATSMSAFVYAGTPIAQSELPKAALTFLAKHFPGDNVKKAEKEQGRRGMEYEVDLTSGAEVDFRDNGDWKEVKAAKGNAVPAAIIPAAISKHVSANYSGQKIVEISRKRGGYEVELSNGTELKLTEDAKPLTERSGGKARGQRGRR